MPLVSGPRSIRSKEASTSISFCKQFSVKQFHGNICFGIKQRFDFVVFYCTYLSASYGLKGLCDGIFHLCFLSSSFFLQARENITHRFNTPWVLITQPSVTELKLYVPALTFKKFWNRLRLELYGYLFSQLLNEKVGFSWLLGKNIDLLHFFLSYLIWIMI